MSDYAHPESLGNIEWVIDRFRQQCEAGEVDVDTSSYDKGHIVGAVGWNWQTQLQAIVSRDLLSKEAWRDF
ncbi:MAG: hypothetical protein Ct9H300mP11_33330 [Chloroflexota bacterium]|nr:MAG: hypothetical protein Ct9H300mP11_33330 [Chloroflexota bacterium]